MGLSLPSQESADSMLFDSGVIDELSGIMSGEDLSTLLADMIRDVLMRLRRIEASDCAPDLLRQIEHDAHDLKSLGGNFGLRSLSHAAGQTEKAARSGEIETVRSNVAGLLATGHDSINAMISQYQINPRSFGDSINR